MFCQKIQEFGVSEAMSFQTDSLYEKTNLPQVVAAIRNFGIEVTDAKRMCVCVCVNLCVCERERKREV